MSGHARYTARLPLAVGFAALALLAGGVGLWSVRTEIAGAVIASGMVVVEHNRQVVQHPEGGVVGAILARDGDAVAAGDVLIRLDDRRLRSELAVVEVQLAELAARSARLEAERSGADEMDRSEDLSGAAARQQTEGQRGLFAARRETLSRELSQMDERIRQARAQIEGTEAQLAALEVQSELTAGELADQEALLAKGLVQAARVASLGREAARLTGEIGRLNADVARLRGQIATFEIEKLRLVSARREEAIAALRDVRVSEMELAETRRGLLDRLAALDIRAPVAGVVYGATVFAEQAVVQAAEPLMYIVPRDQPLIVSARAEAFDIDQIHPGQPATLRFTAFNQRRTPDVAGRVLAVSADVLRDEATGVPYYRVDLLPDPGGVAALEPGVLLPGMPVDAYLKTGARTPLSYLTKPLTDYFSRAMREG